MLNNNRNHLVDDLSVLTSAAPENKPMLFKFFNYVLSARVILFNA